MIQIREESNLPERLQKVKDEWKQISESDWYMSYRKDEVIQEIVKNPKSAFHRKTWEIIQDVYPDLKGLKILVPSSGDNRAVFAFGALGAEVVSCDICEKQLQFASDIAKKYSLNISFLVQDTMKLPNIETEAYDLVYTSEGVHVWIDNLKEMYFNIARVLKKDGVYINYEIHPFTRPFAYDDGKPKGKDIAILRDYETVGPFDDGMTYYWRMQDILNSVCDAGLRLSRLEEMHDEKDKGHFWFYEEERKKMTADEIEDYYDIRTNPLFGLPQWFTFCCRK